MDELALYHSWLQPRLRSWCSQLALNRAHIAEAVEARMLFVSLRYQQKTEAASGKDEQMRYQTRVDCMIGTKEEFIERANAHTHTHTHTHTLV